MSLKVYAWYSCRGPGTRNTWSGVADVLTRCGQRARDAGITLSGVCFDNPFDLWYNGVDDNPLQFDQYLRCRASSDPVRQAVANVGAFALMHRVVNRNFLQMGHQFNVKHYVGPLRDEDRLHAGENRMADCLAPFLAVATQFNITIFVDGSSARPEDITAHQIIDHWYGISTGTEAVPPMASPFNSPRFECFATYRAAMNDMGFSNTTLCPLHILWRGERQEAITHENAADAISSREGVEIWRAAHQCIHWNAALHVNMDTITESDVHHIAVAQASSNEPPAVAQVDEDEGAGF